MDFKYRQVGKLAIQYQHDMLEYLSGIRCSATIKFSPKMKLISLYGGRKIKLNSMKHYVTGRKEKLRSQ